MTEDNQDEPDSSSSLKPTRREVIGTLAGTGALASMAAGQTGSGGGGTVLGIGGGDMADAAAEFRIKYYTPTWSEYQNDFSAGTAGRVVRIVDPSEPDHHGKEFYDNGSSFERLPVNTDLVTTDDIGITSWEKWAALRALQDQHTWFRENFDTIDGFRTRTSGSATETNVSERGIRFETGTTNGSQYEARVSIAAESALQDLTFGKDQEFHARLRIVDSDEDVTIYYGVEEGQQGVEGYGFKLVTVSGTPTLQGYVHNGSSETTTDLQQNPGTTAPRIRAALDAGTDVTFYVDGTEEGSISSAVPTGGLNNNIVLNFSIENTDAVQRRVQLAEYRWWQAL